MTSPRDSYKKPNINEGNNFKKPFPFADGVTLFRLTPPLPEISPDGSWYRYVAQHYGYKVIGRDGTEKLRTFVCPREYNSKTKEERVPCAECHKIEKQKKLSDERTQDYKKQGLSDADIATKLAGLKSWLDAHNRESKHFVRVMAQNGEFGYMKFPWSVFDGVRKLIATLNEQGVDAFDPNGGVWFSVTKTGKGKFGTEYSVAVAQDTIVMDGKRVSTDKVAPLSDEQLTKAIAENPNFDKMVTILPHSTIKELAQSDGSPAVVGAILGVPVNRQEVQEAEAQFNGEPEPVEEVAVVVPTTVVLPDPVGDEIAALKAKLAQMEAAQTKPVVAESQPTKASAMQPEVAKTALNPKSKVEDFISLFGDD